MRRTLRHRSQHTHGGVMVGVGDESPPAEKYGFVVHVLCFPLAIAYLLWAFLPETTLHSWNVTYHPPQQWAVQIPAYLICIFVAAPLFYAGCNILSTPKLDSIYTIHDGPTLGKGSPPPFVHEMAKVGQAGKNDTTLPEIYDIDVGVINRFIYEAQTRT